MEPYAAGGFLFDNAHGLIQPTPHINLQDRHHVFCNNHTVPIGSPGCNCVVVMKRTNSDYLRVCELLHEWLDLSEDRRIRERTSLLADILDVLCMTREHNGIASVPAKSDIEGYAEHLG